MRRIRSLGMHADADQVENGTQKTYKGFPHGMPRTRAEIINAGLLAFLKCAARL
jgi:hypothetical protein